MPGVLKVSEAASLALHTMVYLARNQDSPASTREVAESIQRSEFHLSKVLQRLARAGLVQSLRGPKGGFVLGEGALDATLLEVYEAIEGPLDSTPCLLGTPMCGKMPCVMGGLIHSVNEQFTAYMGSTRLGDFTGAKAPSECPAADQGRNGE